MGQNDSESNQSDMSAKYHFCPNFRDEKKKSEKIFGTLIRYGPII